MSIYWIQNIDANRAGGNTDRRMRIPGCAPAAVVICWLACLTGGASAARAQEPAAGWPGVTEADVALRDFHFAAGDRLPTLRIHYRVLGVPHRDRAGEIDNAVLLLHSTSSSGGQFLTPNFAGQLFGSGQPLDVTRYFVVMPDAIGHGHSAKPSDGLRGSFPRYDYDDMVEAQRQMLAQGLNVHRLRLVLGTSMGCMLTFVWAERHASSVQAAMPIACLPTQIAGQNAVWRTAAVEAIRADPA